MFQSLLSHICAQTNTYILHIKLHRVCKLNTHFLGYSQPRNSSRTASQVHVNLSVRLTIQVHGMYMAAIFCTCAQMAKFNVLYSILVYSILAPEVEFTVTSHSKCMCRTSCVLFELSIYWIFLSHSCVHKLP